MNQPPKILIVEDDQALLSMYQERFRQEKFNVITSCDGDEAVNLAIEELPSIILLDIVMPKKGGLGVLEVLKSRPETKEIPIIILTAYPKDEYRQVASNGGAEAFLSKSETMPGEVVEKIKDILGV